MKKLYLILLSSFLVQNLAQAQNREVYFASYPTLTPDGKTVVFSNYFNTVHGMVEHPLSGELFFSDTWESNFFSNRKHYKGAYNPDIQSYNPKTKAYKQYTDWIGKDFWTTLDQKGNIYFVSDEG